MQFNTLGLATGIAMARRAGVDQSEVARIALPAALFPNIALGAIVADRLAQQEAADEAARRAPVDPPKGATTTPTPGLPPTTTPASTGGTTALPLPQSLPTVTTVEPRQTYEVGQVLRAASAPWQNTGDYKPSYQWFRDRGKGLDPIEGANGPKYEITSEDEDSWLVVEVGYDGVITRSAHMEVGSAPSPTPETETHGAETATNTP